MNSALIACLACLMVLCAQGQPWNRSSSCMCSNGYISRINRHLIKAGPVIHHPSIFCPDIEIIITTTGNKDKCVNPKSPLGLLILKNDKKHRKTAAVSTTTASNQTNTWNSTTLHSTSKL